MFPSGTPQLSMLQPVYENVSSHPLKPQHGYTKTLPSPVKSKTFHLHFFMHAILELENGARVKIPRSLEFMQELRVQLVLDTGVTGQEIETPRQH